MLLKIVHILSPSRLLEKAWIRIGLVYAISLLYVIALAYFISKDNIYLVALPLGLVALWIGLTRMEWLFWLVLFFVPFSFPLKELAPSLSFNMFLPTEPLLAGLVILFIWKFFIDKKVDRQVFNHPITSDILRLNDPLPERFKKIFPNTNI